MPITPFNELMWDSGRSPPRVIEHGVTVPHTVRHRGDLARDLYTAAVPIASHGDAP
jgi:hypothetical protein